MPAFRYPQFCAIARAAELVGERWTILVLRELFIGPQRFGDLRQRLSEVSPSVLSERLGSLEAGGIIEKVELPPPAASTVYQLTDLGREFGGVLRALAKWGMRFLLPPRPGEQLDADRLPIILSMFARSRAVPALRCALRLTPDTPGSSEATVAIDIEGGDDGTHVTQPTDPGTDTDRPFDVTLTGPPIDVISVVAGHADATGALSSGRVRIGGDADKIAVIPRLFDLTSVEPPTQGE